MKKKAYINIILIGAMLIVSVVVFVSTTADDVVWKNKYFNLKKITDSTALSLAKAYNLHQKELDPIDIAEGIADNILDNSNLGSDASNYMTYTWCFKDNNCTVSDKCLLDDKCGGIVTATITNYQHDNFWYKFLGKDQFIFEHIESRVQILGGPVTEASDFLPIAVNGCTQDFPVGEDFSYILKAYDLYEDYDNVGFFGLYEPSGGQSSFAHLKNMLSNILNDEDSNYNIDTDIVSVVTVESDAISNDVKQLSSESVFDIADFDGKSMTIAVLDCNSTAANPIVKELLPVYVSDVSCALSGESDDMLNDLTGSVITDITWASTIPACNNTKFFKLDFTVESITNDTLLEN